MTDRSEIRSIITDAAQRYGVDPGLMWTFSRIESGHNPGARTGQYRGLFQLGPDEWKRWGRGGDIFDPEANANAAARKLSAESATFEQQYGKPPSAHDLYMVHQQGAAGYAAHMANPEAPAWQNMASTGEGRQKGSGWARAAIWGNVTDAQKRQFGSVDNISSQDFMDLWRNKVAGFSGRGTADAVEGRRGAQTSFASYGDLAEMPEGYVPPVTQSTGAPQRGRGRIEGYAAYGEPAAMPEGKAGSAPPSFASYGTIAEQPTAQSSPRAQRLTDEADDPTGYQTASLGGIMKTWGGVPLKQDEVSKWRTSDRVEDRRTDDPTMGWPVQAVTQNRSDDALRRDSDEALERANRMRTNPMSIAAGINDIGRQVPLPPADLIHERQDQATLPWSGQPGGW